MMTIMMMAVVMMMMMMMMMMKRRVMQVTGKYKNTGKRQSVSRLAIDGFGEIMS